MADKKILIADDSSFMRGVLKNILTEGGFNTFVEAGDGEQAIQMIETEKPDLVLLDIIMPGKGGIDVLKAAGASTSVIVVSAVGQESVAEEAKSLGAKGYIVKPFDKEKVLLEVKNILG
jgi:two-component system, chemotaxis family, chemotaxis protein CheY